MPTLFLLATDQTVLIFLAYAFWSAYWGWACWFVASEKARNPGWGWAGFFFGPLAFLPLAVVPDLTEYDASGGPPEQQLGPRLKAQRGPSPGAPPGGDER